MNQTFAYAQISLFSQTTIVFSEKQKNSTIEIIDTSGKQIKK